MDSQNTYFFVTENVGKMAKWPLGRGSFRECGRPMRRSDRSSLKSRYHTHCFRTSSIRSFRKGMHALFVVVRDQLQTVLVDLEDLRRCPSDLILPIRLQDGGLYGCFTNHAISAGILVARAGKAPRSVMAKFQCRFALRLLRSNNDTIGLLDHFYMQPPANKMVSRSRRGKTAR